MAEQIEEVARTVPGVASALAERLEGGRYINVEINREKAARYGMTVADVQLFVTSAVGGAMVGETVKRLPVIQLICVIRKAGAIVRRRCASCRF